MLSPNSSVAGWTPTMSSVYGSSSPPVSEEVPIWVNRTVFQNGGPMSTSTAWITTTAIGTSTVISTITMTPNAPINSLSRGVTATPSPTTTSISAMQVVGIATAVVFGTLLLLSLGAAAVLCSRRVKPPSHSFAALKNTDDESAPESPLILHIAHGKAAWAHEEAEPLAWSTSPLPHTPTTPMSSGASYIGTMATVGSAVDLEAETLPNEHTDHQTLFEQRMRILAGPPSRGSHVLSWSELKRRIQQRTRSTMNQEADSGFRFRTDVPRDSTGPLQNAPPAYTES
ncbi:hypothetical protein C8Q72DRAFT_222865 [Fomitopsis betulina]|nr:hypothetical protein C8Q72DRAFT_222865 [Fomitopsis betulina]